MLEELDGDLNVRTIRVGQKLPSIRGLFRRKLAAVIDYNPAVVFMHLGHNDLVQHAFHNKQPLFSTAVLHQIKEFARA